MVTPLLVVDGLRVRFATAGPVRALLAGIPDRFVDAVLDVSLALEAGRTLAVVGESGSGKTTLGLALLRLQASTGTIEFAGREIQGRRARTLRPLRRFFVSVTSTNSTFTGLCEYRCELTR